MRATTHTDTEFNFADDNTGGTFRVGRGNGIETEEQALNALMNPPLPEVPGIQPPNLDFELGITEQDRQLFTADLTGFQVKLLRATATLSDTVKITDKYGILHEITIGEYLEALDYYHSVLRAAWEAQL